VSDHEPEPIDVLLAEDNPGDVTLTRKAFEKGQVANDLYVVSDGVEAMQFLRNEGPYADTPRPELILLDLNMPRMDGQEVLAELDADPDLHRIPVVVLTSSSAEEDVARSYDLSANAYLTKPVDFAGFTDVVERIEDFWFSVVTMPPE
jgi:CheY-like chemotaxis protein